MDLNIGSDIGAVANFVTEVMKLVGAIEAAFNDPAMRTQKINQMAENLRSQRVSAEAILADPKATPEQKAAAFQQIKLADS